VSELGQQLVNGLMIGCLYALIAVGYTMVYGIIELINFAFGELFMFGAFITIMMMSPEITLFGATVGMPHLNFFLAILIAMAVVGIMGVVIERLAYRPLRNAPRLAALISAIGVSICCRTSPRPSSDPSRSRSPTSRCSPPQPGRPRPSRWAGSRSPTSRSSWSWSP
jgi:branched-chain amino acid transport system permease protein